MNYQHLKRIRDFELEEVVSLMPSGSSILEIGAGAGWQAKNLSERGFHVEAIDVAADSYKGNDAWPVQLYDGTSIPFPDNHFDVVFSSNVLEHIPQCDTFQSEIRRVLKKGGIAIHILPTGNWRFWTLLTHFPNLVKLVITEIVSRCSQVRQVHQGEEMREQSVEANRKHSLAKRVIKKLFPHRHGARGNFLSEIYWFSRLHWVDFFKNTGWRIRAYYGNELFYTGSGFLGSLLNVKHRQQLSHVLGSSCYIYILET